MILLPSRGRPVWLARFTTAYLRTKATLPVAVRLDVDDPTYPLYRQLTFPPNWLVITGERLRTAQTLNELFHTFPNEGCYGLIGDDIVPRTDRWDTLLAGPAKQGNVVFPEGPLTHLFLSGELARAAGFISLPGLKHLYVDTQWAWLGKETGRFVQLNEVVLEHLHFSTGAPLDDTYKDHFQFSQSDADVFSAWKTFGAAYLLVDKIRNLRKGA